MLVQNKNHNCAFVHKILTFSRRDILPERCCSKMKGGGRGKPGDFSLAGLRVLNSSFIFISDREYSVRFVIRHATCIPLRATGQRAQGRALCTPGLATSLPAAARYLHSFMCPLRTGHDSLLLSMTSRRVHAARPGHIHSLSGAMSPDHRC